MFIRDQVARLEELRLHEFTRKREHMLLQARRVHDNINARHCAQTGKPLPTSRIKCFTGTPGTPGSRACYLVDRRALKDLGEVVRQYLHDEADDSDVAEQLKEVASALSESFATRVVEHLQEDVSYRLLDDYIFCGDCGAFEPRDACFTTSSNDEVCESCINDSYAYSECMDTYIASDDMYPVYSSARSYEQGNVDDYCTAYYGDRNLYPHPENSSQYFTDECDADYFRAVFRWQFEGDDIPDYKDSPHRCRSYFRERGATRQFPALGVEIEFDARCARDAHDSLACNHGLIVERDSSLDDDDGLEVVLPPYGRAEWQTAGRDYVKRINNHSSDTPQDYGLHIHLHRRWLSPLQEARMMLFLCEYKNAEFVTAIAGRSSIYSARTPIGGLDRHQTKMANLGGLEYPTDMHTLRLVTVNGQQVERYDRKLRGQGKYRPINWRDEGGNSTAEFRIFQSTTDWNRLYANLEFVWALYRWTLPESGTGTHTHYLDFIEWLNKPANRKEFNTLYSFLCQDTFDVIDDSTIDSPWQSRMCLPVTNPRQVA